MLQTETAPLEVLRTPESEVADLGAAALQEIQTVDSPFQNQSAFFRQFPDNWFPQSADRFIEDESATFASRQTVIAAAAVLYLAKTSRHKQAEAIDNVTQLLDIMTASENLNGLGEWFDGQVRKIKKAIGRSGFEAAIRTERLHVGDVFPSVQQALQHTIASQRHQTIEVPQLLTHVSAKPAEARKPKIVQDSVEFDDVMVDGNVLDGELNIAKSGAENDEASSGIDGESLINMYLRQIGKVPLLKTEEEVELGKQIEAGVLAQEILDSGADLGDEYLRDLQMVADQGVKAKEHFINANLRLVVHVAKKYLGHGMEFLDLIQEGNDGLMHAVEMFDYSRGFKFSTYATKWIQQTISRAFANKGRTIRYPAHVHEKIVSIQIASAKILDEFGREPTPGEIAEKTGFDEQLVVKLLGITPQPVSLEKPIGEDKIEELGSFIEDSDQADFAEPLAAIQRADAILALVDTLDEAEAKILKWRFGLEGSEKRMREDIAKELGITPQGVSYLEKKILTKLRHPSRLLVLQQSAGLEESWYNSAMCAQVDPELFFPKKGYNTGDARQICGSCVVRWTCLDTSLENKEKFGVWGGHSESERTKWLQLGIRSSEEISAYEDDTSASQL